MKTLENTNSLTRPGKSRVGIGGDSRARYDKRYKLDRKKTGDNEVDGKVDDEVDDEIEKKGQKTSKSKKTVRSDFFIPSARLAFTKLKQIFFKTLILHYFNP